MTSEYKLPAIEFGRPDGVPMLCVGGEYNFSTRRIDMWANFAIDGSRKTQECDSEEDVFKFLRECLDEAQSSCVC